MKNVELLKKSLHKFTDFLQSTVFRRLLGILVGLSKPMKIKAVLTKCNVNRSNETDERAAKRNGSQTNTLNT